MVETFETINFDSDALQRTGFDQAVQVTALSTQASFEVRVLSRQTVAEGIVLIELGRPDNGALPSWTPGAHIALETQDFSGKPGARQYSLCGPADSATWQIAILADTAGRGGSVWLHENALLGAALIARGPANHFPLEAEQAPVVLIAGGIGITPLISMANALEAHGLPFRLHYHTRRRSSCAFLEELSGAAFADKLRLSFDEETPTPISSIFSQADAESLVYICGPFGFMEAVADAAHSFGIPPARIRRELFAAAPSVTPERTSTEQAFMVKIQSTGQLVEVPVGKTVVQALAGVGVNILVSCEQGLCGSCLTTVLDGMPDHRDQFMLPEEHLRNDAFTPCCSRALSACLVLDV
jgi:vanillate O-demethylase ferredoxin subunit